MKGRSVQVDRKRLDKVESSLTPREIVALWLQEIEKFDSLQEYALWAADNLSQAPLTKMLQQVKDGLLRHSGRRRENEFRELFRKRSRKVVFLYYLVRKANDHISQCVSRERLRIAAIIAGVHATMAQVRSAVTTFKIWCALHYIPYPLDTEAAAAVLAVLKNHVTPTSDLLDHVIYQSDGEEMASEPVCEQLNRALNSLCRSGLVKRGSCVRLGSSSMEFLASPPLVDDAWIDAKAVELAEYAALLREKGVDLETVDSHVLAPLRPCRRKEQTSDDLDEAEVDSVRSENAIHLSKFPGRTKEIDGRIYLHLDDYRAWGDRKADGDLQIIEGVFTKSWNAWVDAAGDQPELVGIPVCRLDALVDQVDFFSCDDPERQRRREQSVSLMRMSMADRMEASQISRFLDECQTSIPKLLIEVRSVTAAMKQIASDYFHGVEITFKSDADAIKALAKDSNFLADYYNFLIDMIKTDDGAIVFGTKIAEQVEKIDHGTESVVGKRTADLVRTLVDLARAEMFAFFEENDRANEIWKAIIRGESGYVE